VVEEGGLAPDFTLTSDSGETITLSALRGKPVVLYFYPKDDTLGRFDSSADTTSCGWLTMWAGSAQSRVCAAQQPSV
jgi:peroxiredoxin